MKYIFHPAALNEYLEAVSYYAKISPRLAQSFIKAFETGIERILTNPKAWTLLEEDIRRHILHRFPFGIYYCEEKEHDRIAIYGVLHMNRHPKTWKIRIE